MDAGWILLAHDEWMLIQLGCCMGADQESRARFKIFLHTHINVKGFMPHGKTPRTPRATNTNKAPPRPKLLECASQCSAGTRITASF